MIFGNDRHLRCLLTLCQTYCKEARTHLSLSKDAPVSGCVQAIGGIIAKLLLGGLHHQHARI
jgi:hypothetical protein